MPDARAGAAETWDRNASRYERQTRFALRAARRAVALAAPAAEDRVLDIAAGTGLLLDRLREIPDPPRSVLAIDRSAAMLARVRSLRPEWSTLRADARALPLEAGCADVVLIGYLLQLLSARDVEQVLGEAHRVLAAGGRVVTITPHVPRRSTCRLGPQPLDGPAARAAARLGWLGAALLDGPAALAPARLGGLRTHDPRAGLAQAGFALAHASQLRHGYPSLIVLARRR